MGKSQLKLVAMQPYFLPYGGYFSLLSSADKIVFLDTDQYVKRRWMNRCRVRTDEKDSWLTVPVRGHSQSEEIRNIEVAKETTDFSKALKKTERIAPEWAAGIENILHFDSTQLSATNISLLSLVFSRLQGVDLQFELLSKMSTPYFQDYQERAVWLTKTLGCDTYLNASGGRDLYDEGYFQEQGLKLSFMPNYSEKPEDFLSVVCEPDIYVLRRKISNGRV